MSHKGVASEELPLLVDMARTHESVFAVDTACRIVFLNEQAEALLGYRASDVIGGRCCDALHLTTTPGSRRCAMCIGALGTSVSPPSSSRFVVAATTQAGAHIWLRVLALPAHNAVGRPRTVHVLRAISPEEFAHEHNAATQADRADIALHLEDPSEHPADVAGEHPRQPPQRRLLTPREMEVLTLLAAGRSNANIAALLSISPVTARNHVTSIIEKLGANTRLQAVVLASRNGLLHEGNPLTDHSP